MVSHSNGWRAKRRLWCFWALSMSRIIVWLCNACNTNNNSSNNHVQHATNQLHLVRMLLSISFFNLTLALATHLPLLLNMCICWKHARTFDSRLPIKCILFADGCRESEREEQRREPNAYIIVISSEFWMKTSISGATKCVRSSLILPIVLLAHTLCLLLSHLPSLISCV